MCVTMGLNGTKRMALPTQMTRELAAKQSNKSKTTIQKVSQLNTHTHTCAHTESCRQSANDLCPQDVLLFSANTGRPAGRQSVKTVQNWLICPSLLAEKNRTNWQDREKTCMNEYGGFTFYFRYYTGLI